MTLPVPNPILYCPRCDRRFRVPLSAARSRARLDKHIKLAHPDYYDNFWKD